MFPLLAVYIFPLDNEYMYTVTYKIIIFYLFVCKNGRLFNKLGSFIYFTRDKSSVDEQIAFTHVQGI